MFAIVTPARQAIAAPAGAIISGSSSDPTDQNFAGTISYMSPEQTLEEPLLANTWDRDSRGEHPRAVVEAVDPESVGIDPLKYM